MSKHDRGTGALGTTKACWVGAARAASGVLIWAVVACGGNPSMDPSSEDGFGGAGGAPGTDGAPAASGGTPASGGEPGAASGGDGSGGRAEPVDLSMGDGIVFPRDPLLEVDGTDVIVAGRSLYPSELGFDAEAASDAYVLRIDEDLAVTHEFRFSGARPEVMARHSDGTLAIAGTLWMTTELGDATYEPAEGSYYVAWFNDDLELLGSAEVTSEPTSTLNSAVFDADGNVVIVGAHSVPADEVPYRHESLTVVSLETAKSQLWHHSYSGTGSSAWASDAELMPDGSILLVGGFNYTLMFGGQVLQSGGDPYEGMFVRLSATDGTPLLVESFGGTDYQYALDALVTEEGNVLVAGSAQGSFSLGGMNAAGHAEGGLFVADVSAEGVASGLLALEEVSHARHVLTASPEPQLIASFESPQRVVLGTWTGAGLVAQTIVQDEDAFPGEAIMDSVGHIWLTTQFLDAIELPVGSFLGKRAGAVANDWVLWRLDPQTL